MKNELTESAKEALKNSFEARGFAVKFTEKYLIATKNGKVEKIDAEKLANLFALNK